MKKIYNLYYMIIILMLTILIFSITSFFVTIKYFAMIEFILVFITFCMIIYYIYYMKKIEKFNGCHDRFSHLHTDILFINIDNPFDIKKPYHFLSPKKAIELNKKYAFSDDAKNYLMMSIINNKLYLFCKIDEDDNVTNLYDLFNYSHNNLYKITILHDDLIYNSKLLRLIHLTPTSSNKKLNNVIKCINEHNLTEKQLIYYYLRLDKQLDLNDNEIEQYSQDYIIAYNELKKLNELDNAKNYEKFMTNQNFEVDKSSQIYDDISDVIDQLNKIKK